VNVLVSHEEITDVRFVQVFCQRNSSATVEEYSSDILDDQFLTEVHLRQKRSFRL
jgi:hypothetical protein